MILTTTVRMAGVLFLVCAGSFHFIFASNHLRIFRIPKTKDVFRVALQACNQTHESCVTLYDDEDAKFIHNLLLAEGPEESVWLGLRKDRNTTWSDGSPVNFSNSSVNVTDEEQMCEAIDNNTWTGSNCSDRKYFMCYKGNNYTLVKENRTWCQALQYCRKHFDDLVSIRNETENDDVIRKGESTSFWIGLLHDNWEWEEGGCSSYREWTNTESRDPEDPEECTVSSPDNPKLLHKYHCSSNTAYSFCSKGNMRIRVVDKNLTWEEAFNYCKANHSGPLWIEDAEDQQAVQKWLNYTYNASNDSLLWIGLRQSRVFGFWIWSDRTVSYSNWKNDTQPQVSVFDRCGAISGTDYMWKNADCSLQLPFLCEEEIVFMDKSRNHSYFP
ncbi:secretory phospholipase A2 receptor [Epinephelus lanceolatus]